MEDGTTFYEEDMNKNEHPIVTGDYIIVTPQIKALTENILFIITNKLTGALIYGIARGGKTTAKRCLIKAINKLFKSDSVIFSVSCSGGRYANEKRFLTDLLGGIGLPIKTREQTEDRRERIINYLISRAKSSKGKKVILFMDDSQNLKEINYIQLMDIYNRLDDSGITLSTILIGSDELKDTMDKFIKEGKSHIVGRFMVHDFNFTGIRNLEQFTAVLKFYDEKCYPTDSDCCFTKYFFPEAYDKGYRVVQDAETIMKLICDEIGEMLGSPLLNIPMLPITLSINDCFKKAGIREESKYKPSMEDWQASIERAKYSRYIM